MKLRTENFDGNNEKQNTVFVFKILMLLIMLFKYFCIEFFYSVLYNKKYNTLTRHKYKTQKIQLTNTGLNIYLINNTKQTINNEINQLYKKKNT